MDEHKLYFKQSADRGAGATSGASVTLVGECVGQVVKILDKDPTTGGPRYSKRTGEEYITVTLVVAPGIGHQATFYSSNMDLWKKSGAKFGDVVKVNGLIEASISSFNSQQQSGGINVNQPVEVLQSAAALTTSNEPVQVAD
jgi:hypothetical protein